MFVGMCVCMCMCMCICGGNVLVYTYIEGLFVCNVLLNTRLNKDLRELSAHVLNVLLSTIINNIGTRALRIYH